jgi:NAD-dependent SIR2 family protein deacetylase
MSYNLPDERERIAKAVELIDAASAILITAGAGMSVDSGLPDFRGPEGFWRAYPALRHTGLRFEEMANPLTFERDPALAWAFYGHRLDLYRQTEPHDGYRRLLDIAANRPCFVVTSNVDGAFQKAGFAADQVYEIHGSIHHIQCTGPCCETIWSGDGVCIDIDAQAFRALGDLPFCPNCYAVARPNILMFGDGRWVSDRSELQRQRFAQWLDKVGDDGLAVVEIGAGTAVPSIRHLSEQVGSRFDAPLLRINPREPACALANAVSLPMGGLAAIEAITK